MKNLLLIGLLLLGTTTASFASESEQTLGEQASANCVETIQNNRNGTANDVDAVAAEEEDTTRAARVE